MSPQFFLRGSIGDRRIVEYWQNCQFVRGIVEEKGNFQEDLVQKCLAIPPLNESDLQIA